MHRTRTVSRILLGFALAAGFVRAQTTQTTQQQIDQLGRQLIRRARPVFEGTIYKYIDYFVRPDFGKGTVAIYDAYAELNYFSRAKLRVGYQFGIFNGVADGAHSDAAVSNHRDFAARFFATPSTAI